MPLAWVPNFLLQWKLLSPMRYATQGTVDAAQLALKNGVGINLGGGYHHAKNDEGGGFCVYADIPLALKELRKENPNLKVLYIDLDAHQGNGVESCLFNDQNTYVVDCYNENNYPHDLEAAQKINKKIISNAIYCEIHKNRQRGPGHVCVNCNNQYLTAIKHAISESLEEFKPDFIFQCGY